MCIRDSLETDNQKKNILFQQIYEDISKNLVPIRPDRHYTTTKGRLAGKYSNTHKRAEGSTVKNMERSLFLSDYLINEFLI